MNLSKYFVRGVVFTACVAFLSAAAHAQYRGSIQGVVTDPQGAVVSGATVTLTNQDTNQTQVATTNDSGVYNFNALPPARFSITVEKDGFEKKVLEHLTIIPEQANAVNVQLEVGAVAQSVTVNGDSTPLIDTETASLNGTVNDREIQHLPSFGRDVLKLAQLAPGSFADGAQGQAGGGFNLPGTQTGGGASGGADGIFKTENGAQVISSGQQTQNNGISIDGISTTSVVWGGSSIITPSEDSVDSVKIISNSYDAEDGRFSGSQIQIISKSGTNNFHGSLFFTNHEPAFNSFQKFNGNNLPVTKDANKFDQLGGSVGGPIWKNKIFGFFTFEGEREPFSPLQGNGWFETPAFAALAPAGSIAAKFLSFPGNGVVGTLNPNATCADAGLIDAAHVSPQHPTANCAEVTGGLNIGTPLNPATFPLGAQDPGFSTPTNPGTGGDGSGGAENLGTVADIANYTTLNRTQFTANQYSGRIDANITQKDRVSFSVYWVPLSRDNLNGGRAYDVFHHTQLNEAFAVIWDHTISPNFLNEARANAAGWRWNEIVTNPQSPVGFPQANIGTTGTINLNSFGPNVGSILNQWTYSVKDVATKIIGRHSVKFGGEITRLFYLQDNPSDGNGVPSYGFFNIWDFLNDAPRSEQANFNAVTGFPSTQRQDDRQNIWGFFIQDDFKVRSNLTINVGLRWSYFAPLYSKQNNLLRAVPGPGSALLTGLTVRKENAWEAQSNNFGPQIGFAWTPKSLFNRDFSNRLVFRGGYGLSYTGEEIALTSNIFQNPGFTVSPNLSRTTPSISSCAQPLPNCGVVYAVSSSVHNLNGYPANPNTTATFGANGLPTTGSPNVVLFPQTMPTTRVHHYSLEGEYDVGHQWVASLGYQGSISSNILFHENPLAVPAVAGFPFNPRIGGGDFWSNAGHGNYNALLAGLKHQFSHQLSAESQFTWSKCMDTSSGPFFEQPYPFDRGLEYGRCDYNVGKAFKLFGVWQPVIFHGNHSWLEKVAGGWSLSGIFNMHSGFPWTPVVNFGGSGSLYCGQCGYSTVFPTAYLGNAGNSTSIDSFKTVAKSNFPNCAGPTGCAAYFTIPVPCSATVTTNCFTTFTGTASGTALPPNHISRNSFLLPGYKDLDLSLAKAFGLPKAPILGESANIELRVDTYNLFNNLNFDPSRIVNDVASSNFGTITGALAGRVFTVGARFSF